MSRRVKSSRVAFVTGITGQDGSYLAELLLEKGYTVHGLIRRASNFNTHRINHLYQDPHTRPGKLFLHFGDIADSSSVNRLLRAIEPHEIYNLGAQSHVRVSFDMPEYTADVTALGTLRLLDAIRDIGIAPRFYQASSSEMFGKAHEIPLTEVSPFHPRSPYGVAKVFSYWITRNYRESYGMFATNGILFNHESERRGETFVTRKITKGLAQLKAGTIDRLHLGNLDAKRDWGHARDYVEGMWKMLQHHEPDDFILATNETHTVREFAEKAAAVLGFRLTWKGTGIREKGIDTKTGRTLIEIDPRYFRPAEVDVLQGDYSKAQRLLGWEPRTSFEELVERMVRSDYDHEKRR